MQDIYVGMFVEKHKGKLLTKDLTNAVNALKKCDDTDANKLINAKTKNPIVATALSITFGWLGLDKFYIGLWGKGIFQLLCTAICVGLAFLCNFTIHSLESPISLGFVDISVSLAQALSFLATIAMYITYIIGMSINAYYTSLYTKKQNVEILKLVNIPIPNWFIGK